MLIWLALLAEVTDKKIIARSNQQSKNIFVVTIPFYQLSHISEPVLVFLVTIYVRERYLLYSIYPPTVRHD